MLLEMVVAVEKPIESIGLPFGIDEGCRVGLVVALGVDGTRVQCEQ